MRLQTLTINGFKNLDGLTIQFHSASDTCVMLGGNGTGKSNVIEALVAIFADVDLQRQPAFDYELFYECRQRTVCVSARRGDPLPTVEMEGTRQRLPKQGEKVPDYMPDHIVAYYSGPGGRLEEHFADHLKREQGMLRDPTKETYSPFIYCQPQYSDFLLLSCFTSSVYKIRDFVSGRLGIKRIESVHFDLVKPRRRPTRSTKIAAVDGDDRFWSATGEVAYILGLLWDHALLPYKDQGESSRKPGPFKTEHLYLYLADQDSLREAAKPFGLSYGFFRHLCYLHTIGMVNEVTTLVHRRGSNKPFSFSEFSEGERQLLTIVGLLSMVEGGENLILLDEPDTHLNPRWKYEYLSILRPSLEKQGRNQLVITTHDPLMIGELHKEQVYLFRRDQEEQKIVVEHPEEDPIGIGIEGLLKSELFGLRSTLAPEILQKLDRHYLLLGTSNKTPDEQKELMRLANELNSLAVSLTHPNPYFELFARAMARRRSEMTQPPLSKEKIEAQAKLADELLDEILAEEHAAESGRTA